MTAPSPSLKNREEIVVFLTELDSRGRKYLGEAIDNYHPETNNGKYMSLCFYGPIGEAYLNAAEKIAENLYKKSEQSLDRKALKEMLETKIFRSGRASEDFCDNVLKAFDDTVTVLKHSFVPAVNQKAPPTEKNFDQGTNTATTKARPVRKPDIRQVRQAHRCGR